MPVRIDERYNFLEVENRRKLRPYMLDEAIKKRPNINTVDIGHIIETYGMDITALSLVSDSPLGNPLSSDLENVLLASWRLVNRIWQLRLFEDSSCPAGIKGLSGEYNIRVAGLHSAVKNLEKEFSRKSYLEVLENISDLTPNLAAEISSFLKS